MKKVDKGEYVLHIANRITTTGFKTVFTSDGAEYYVNDELVAYNTNSPEAYYILTEYQLTYAKRELLDKINGWFSNPYRNIVLGSHGAPTYQDVTLTLTEVALKGTYDEKERGALNYLRDLYIKNKTIR